MLQAALKREPLSNGWGRERDRGRRPPVCVSLATKHPSWQRAESLLRLKAFNNRLDEEKDDLLDVALCRREGETMTLQFRPKWRSEAFSVCYLLTSNRKRQLLVVRNPHDAAQPLLSQVWGMDKRPPQQGFLQQADHTLPLSGPSEGWITVDPHPNLRYYNPHPPPAPLISRSRH